MNEKFKNIPTDEDTKIISEFETKFDTLDCVLQTWLYDGIQGTSLIFFKPDLENTTPEIIKNEIKASGLLKDLESTITFSQNPKHDYAFFNFNFIEEEFLTD